MKGGGTTDKNLEMKVNVDVKRRATCFVDKRKVLTKEMNEFAFVFFSLV